MSELQLTLDQKIDNLQMSLDRYIKLSTPNAHDQLGSSQQDLLFTALALAQLEMEGATNNKINSFYKGGYADLQEVVKVSRPHLAKNGLAVIHQIFTNTEGNTIMNTILTHNSGQWISSQIRILPDKSDAQSIGKYITYMRRYAYAALVGVTWGEIDDDGESLVADNRSIYAKGPALNNGTSITTKEGTFDTLTGDQIEQIEWELQNEKELTKDILEKMQINSLADIPKKHFIAVMKKIRDIKAIKK